MTDREREELFYVCSLIEHIGRKTNYEQAKRWARRDRNRVPRINHFAFEELPGLSIKKFVCMTDEWLDFIADSRGGKGHVYDLVEGPMANDTIGRQLQNLPRHRRFHRNRPTCFAKIGAILVGRHRRCRRFNEVLQLPLWNYVNDFVNGIISREAFWALAKFRYPTHQICFHTPAALRCLKFLKCEEISRDEA